MPGRETALVMGHAWPRSLAIMGLTVGMCVVAGMVAVRRAATKSPAELL